MDRPSVPQATEWQRIGNQIDTASIFARVYFVTVPSWLSGVNPKSKMCRVSGQFQLILFRDERHPSERCDLRSCRLFRVSRARG